MRSRSSMRHARPILVSTLSSLHCDGQFLFPGSWQLMRFSGGYQETPNDDPIYLYQDVPVAFGVGQEAQQRSAIFPDVSYIPLDVCRRVSTPSISARGRAATTPL